MPTPRKADILSLARKKTIERDIRAGLPSITAEESELKETGSFQEAQTDLMRGVEAGAYAEQERYLSGMAGEMGLKLIPVKELTILKRQHGIEYTNGWSHTKKAEPRRQRVSLRQPLNLSRVEQVIASPLRVLGGVSHGRRKRRMKGKINGNRTSKTMRKLRHVKGRKSFSFPDSVWKIKRRRRKKR